MSRAEANLVSCFAAGMSSCTLHPGDHKSISRYVAETLEILKALQPRHSLSVTVHDDGRMFINEFQVLLDTPAIKRFFLKLRHNKVTKIIISKGVQADELEGFFADLASSGGFFHSYANIAVKSIKNQPGGDMLTGSQVLKDDVSHIKRVYHDIAVYRSINMLAANAVLGSFISNIRKGALIRNMLVPMKADSDDLYNHSANVAMLSILQAEHLGFGNALLHDIGLAALLHDVGKTLLPKNILDRQYSLDEAEWAVMKKHPAYGAALLASLNKVPEIAIVVAYEHHMKYDGTGYPETRRRTKKQHIISQIVAIADFYCALSAGLPHRNPFGDSSIMELFAEISGRELNPLLVGNFVETMGGHYPAAL
jgi:putative nucleotidyltransferase with HDIG domain